MICCATCKENKEEHLFHKSKSKKSGFLRNCKDCHNTNQRYAYEKLKENLTTEEFKLRKRRKQLKHCYGISLDEYDKKLEEQSFKCSICEMHEKDAPKGILFVDHCHKTKKVRGLVCQHCNSALGHARDSILILSKCILYLEKYK